MGRADKVKNNNSSKSKERKEEKKRTWRRIPEEVKGIMDFIPQPEEAKRFGSIKWLKWHIMKYPTVFIIFAPMPYLFYKWAEIAVRQNREFNNGTYVPNVVQNRYAICRPDDWQAKNTPKRYTN